jgi:hypothetical protein
MPLPWNAMPPSPSKDGKIGDFAAARIEVDSD